MHSGEKNVLKVQYHINGGKIDTSKGKGYTSNSSGIICTGGAVYYQIWNYNQTYKYGLTNISTFALSKTGYSFIGWGTKTSGGTVFDQDDGTLKATDLSSALNNGDVTMTLYAQWTDSKVISKVELYSGPNKTKYQSGEGFSKTGIKLKITYTSGTTAIINGESYATYTTNTDNANNIRYVVTVSYKGYTFKINTYKDGWYGTELGVWYYYRNNNKVVGDQTLDWKGKTFTYHFTLDGKMYTGWREDGGEYRYYTEWDNNDLGITSGYLDPAQKADWFENEGMERGVLLTNRWANIRSADGNYYWYYFGDGGWMKKGWQQIGGYWYYMNTAGQMQTGWIQLSGIWYYLKPAGFTGWSGPTGSMLANTSAKIDGKTYKFDGNGHCLNP